MNSRYKKSYKVLSAFIVFMMLLSVFPCSAFASADELTYQEGTIEIADTDFADSEELFNGYISKLFYGEEIAVWGTSARSQLNDAEKQLYDYLKVQFENIACGEISSTVINVDDATANNFTAETLADSAKVTIEALMHDCPYELYWYDKVAKTGFSCSSDANGIVDLTIVFPVAAAYQAAGSTANAPLVNMEKVQVAQEALACAFGLVEKYADYDDYDKLKAFCDEICDRVSYNYEAADTNYTGGFGDPWEMIYVFDNDPDTTVVCEGYAKAFQYLCDMSGFKQDIYCYTVSGMMGGATGEGAHMWNIVSINGQNYLADITNTDEGTVGDNYELFLAGTPGINRDHYAFAINGEEVFYLYGPESLELWGDYSTERILDLAEENYDPAATTTPDNPSEETGYQLTFVYNDSLCDFIAYDWFTNEYVENGGYLPINEVEDRAFAVFEIRNITPGYRIKDFLVNGVSRADTMIDGAYGGCAITIAEDSVLEVVLEPIPANLPVIESAVIYTYQFPREDSKIAKNVRFETPMTGLHAVVTFEDGNEYPEYYANCDWEYSVDGGETWIQVPGWGTRSDFKANWAMYQDYGLDFMTMEDYMIRARLVAKANYCSTGPVPNIYSEPVRVNSDVQDDSDNTETSQLAAPTNLRWNVNEAGQTEYGYISWDTVENCEGEYYYEIYKDGELYDLPCGREARSFYTDEYGDRVTVNVKTELNESGTYTFAVQAVGDGESYTDSEMVTSSEYVYVRPSKELATPTDLKWVNTTRYWKPVEGAWAYEIYYYKDGWLAGSTWERPEELTTDGEWVYTNETWLFDLIEMMGDGRGKWSFKVLAFSDDITKTANSAISEMSPTTDIGELSYQIGDQLEEWNMAVGNGVISAAEARSRLLAEDKGNLAAALAASDSVVMGLNDLDDLYRYEQGITVDVYVSETAMSTGVADPSKITITGAALNTDVANTEVSFNISKSKNDYPIDNPLQYKNTVFMDMDLSGDGINPDGSLEVPVHIKMPVPANITVPERFRILHFLNSQGEYELIVPAITYEAGEAYASFILTHFSPFAFTEAKTQDEMENGPGGSDVALKGDVDLNGAVNMDDVVALLNHVVKAEIIVDSAALAAGEVTNDAELNMDDVVKLLNYVVKAIDSLD